MYICIACYTMMVERLHHNSFAHPHPPFPTHTQSLDHEVSDQCARLTHDNARAVRPGRSSQATQMSDQCARLTHGSARTVQPARSFQARHVQRYLSISRRLVGPFSIGNEQSRTVHKSGVLPIQACRRPQSFLRKLQRLSRRTGV